MELRFIIKIKNPKKCLDSKDLFKLAKIVIKKSKADSCEIILDDETSEKSDYRKSK